MAAFGINELVSRLDISRFVQFPRFLTLLTRSRRVRFAGKVRIEEQPGNCLEIHDGEERLIVVLANPRPSPDNLLENRYRTDRLVNHDQLASLGVDARVEQSRSRGDDGVRFIVIDEIRKLGFALPITAPQVVRRPWLAVLGWLFVLAIVGAGGFFGWRYYSGQGERVAAGKTPGRLIA